MIHTLKDIILHQFPYVDGLFGPFVMDPSLLGTNRLVESEKEASNSRYPLILFYSDHFIYFHN